MNVRVMTEYLFQWSPRRHCGMPPRRQSEKWRPWRFKKLRRNCQTWSTSWRPVIN